MSCANVALSACQMSASTKPMIPSFDGLSTRILPFRRSSMDPNAELESKCPRGRAVTVCDLRTLRERIVSVSNTKKITDAMKLVAAAKVRRAQEAVVNGRPFSETLVQVLYNLNEQLQTEDVEASSFSSLSSAAQGVGRIKIMEDTQTMPGMRVRMAIWIFVVVFSMWVSIDKNRCVLFRGSASTSNPGDALALVAGPSPNPAGLVIDFYRISCPSAESIIQTTVQELERNFSNVAPALLRMVFHDCFVQGCDASILLGIVEGFWPEKEAFPNSKSLRGYEFIAIIKARLESACPLTVSCADIIALSARDAVAMMGGPFFTLPTGRRDGTRSIATVAEANLPSPDEDVDQFTKKFKAMGFDDRDIVSLLGAHTIGRAHCRFVEGRLTNFRGTGKPDPTINTSFAQELRSMCNRNDTRMDPLVPMDNGSDRDFDVHYYQNILAGKGLLHVDQALSASEHTRTFVNAYAADKATFFNDFSRAMVKLTSLNVLTGRQGQIRKNCSKVESGGQYIEPEIIP